MCTGKSWPFSWSKGKYLKKRQVFSGRWLTHALPNHGEDGAARGGFRKRGLCSRPGDLCSLCFSFLTYKAHKNPHVIAGLEHVKGLNTALEAMASSTSYFFYPITTEWMNFLKRESLNWSHQLQRNSGSGSLEDEQSEYLLIFSTQHFEGFCGEQSCKTDAIVPVLFLGKQRLSNLFMAVCPLRGWAKFIFHFVWFQHLCWFFISFTEVHSDSTMY